MQGVHGNRRGGRAKESTWRERSRAARFEPRRSWSCAQRARGRVLRSSGNNRTPQVTFKINQIQAPQRNTIFSRIL